MFKYFMALFVLVVPNVVYGQAQQAQQRIPRLVATVENSNTGIVCTHWSITQEQRDYVAEAISVTLSGYPSAVIQASKKQPSCVQHFGISKADLPAGKSLDTMSTNDILVVIKTKLPSFAAPSPGPLGPDGKTLPLPGPMFKDAKIE